MNLIRTSIERPIAVVAVTLMVLLFGIIALKAIPVQLAPDVNAPVINISTLWPGAAPAEIEREIVNRQEEVLAGLEGLEDMSSSSTDSQGNIELEFAVGTDMNKALLLVANRLDRVSNYPAEAFEPSLRTAGADDNAIAWFILTRVEGNTRPIHTYGEFADDVIKERFERVPGVGLINVYGGTERELQIILDPYRMASFGLTIGETVAALRAANISASAGDLDEGKRRYIVRTEGELASPEAVREVLLKSTVDPVTGLQNRVTVGDVASLRFAFTDPGARIRNLATPSIAINAVRETGANVIETMDGLRVAVEELNARALPAAGLQMKQVYDETIYIDSAIALVQQNIWVGGALAAIILMLFLRSFGATAIITVAIPVSVVGAFVAMAALGRSINVISLAGLAFAVGMVVDAAIVVLENIYRLRQRGLPLAEAAYRGASEVWGAVLVSALTTVMVFIPILVLQLEVGQLFRDIAVAISVAVVLSLIVSITVIPALSLRWLTGDLDRHAQRKVPFVDPLARSVYRGLNRYAAWATTGRTRAGIVVVVVCGLSALTTALLMPKLEYLPEGNRNLIFGIIMPPPGYNLDTTTSIAEQVEGDLKPLWVSETGPESEPGQPPKIEEFFFVATGNRTFLGASSIDPQRASELLGPMQGPVFKEPGTFGFMLQPSIFGRGVGGGRAIDLDISGPDLETLLRVAQQTVGHFMAAFPMNEGNQFTPRPGLELGAPEVRVLPHRTQLADAGITAQELALTIDTWNDGVRVAEITVGSSRLDLTLMGDPLGLAQTQDIGNLPVITADGSLTRVADLADVILTQGPTEIRHRERLRTITLQVRPAPHFALEEAMDKLRSEVIAPMQEAGLPPGVRIKLSGTADKLDTTWQAMQLQLLVALVIVYLVMAILFESFFYPVIILLSVPLATAGAMLGINLVMSLYPTQKFDMLTLLGFVILIGIVVNNAILLVHQTLHHLRQEGMDPRTAILEAVSNRIRPIFMSTLTSLFGMLPLVLFPGAGSELYRGLGSVVLGGLALSALLTLAIIPPLLYLFIAPAKPEAAAVPDMQQPTAAM